jgi:hypothetical protein
MNDLLGFTALSIALFALSKKNIIGLRWWHLLSSSIYIIYGLIIDAPPVVVGAVLYCGIHSWKLYRYYKTQEND